MIRYVLAALVGGLLIAASMPVIDQVAVERSDKQVEAQLTEIGNAATALVANEEVPASGEFGGTRALELSLPTGSMLSRHVRYIEFEPLDGVNKTHVRYAVEDGSVSHHYIGAEIVGVDGGSFRLKTDDRQRIALKLTRGSDDEKVVLLKHLS